MEFITYLLLGAGLVILGEAVCLTIVQYALNNFSDHSPNVGKMLVCSDDENADNDENDETPLTNQETVSDLPNSVPRTQFDQTYDERIAQFKNDLAQSPVSKTPPVFFDMPDEIANDDGVEIITERYEKEFEEHNKI